MRLAAAEDELSELRAAAAEVSSSSNGNGIASDALRALPALLQGRIGVLEGHVARLTAELDEVRLTT